MAQRGYRTIKFPGKKNTEIAVLASPRTADALAEIVANADVYDGVKLTQIMEAVYAQGHKDGAREAIDELDTELQAVQKRLAPRRPGRPKKR
jgi:hypothetical protein